jgi:hypothetical protein
VVSCWYAKNAMIKGGLMSIVTTVVFSLFLLTVTGCVIASPPPDAKQEMMGKKGSTVKPAKHDEKKAMNEESINAIR